MGQRCNQQWLWGSQGVKAEWAPSLAHSPLILCPPSRAQEGHFEGKQSSLWDICHLNLWWVRPLLVKSFGKMKHVGVSGNYWGTFKGSRKWFTKEVRTCNCVSRNAVIAFCHHTLLPWKTCTLLLPTLSCPPRLNWMQGLLASCFGLVTLCFPIVPEEAQMSTEEDHGGRAWEWQMVSPSL